MNRAESTEERRTPVLVLAGGQGERLIPLTRSLPKPAISFNGAFRLIDFTLSNCLNSGLMNVALLIQYRHEELQAYIWRSWSEIWNLMSGSGECLRCLPPTSGKRYRGTADAVYQNLSILARSESPDVLILAADHVYRMDYSDLLRQHRETNADLTVSTVDYPAHEAAMFGVLETDPARRITAFAEKPLLPMLSRSRNGFVPVSMGVYAFKREALTDILLDLCENAANIDFGRHILPAMVASGRAFAYSFRQPGTDSFGYWRDIGTIDTYFEASMEFVSTNPPFDPYRFDQRFSEDVHGWPAGLPGRWPRVEVQVNEGVHVRQTVLSPGVKIERGAHVEKSVLLPGVCVGPNARLRRVIVDEGIRLPAGFTAGWDLEWDRAHHTVSPNGVVVVSRVPELSQSPSVMRFVGATRNAR